MRHLLSLLTIGLTACSTVLPPIPLTHPANPQAQVGTVGPFFSGLHQDEATGATKKLLAASDSTTSSTTSESSHEHTKMTHPMDHSQMNHSEMDHSKMDHQGH